MTKREPPEDSVEDLCNRFLKALFARAKAYYPHNLEMQEEEILIYLGANIPTKKSMDEEAQDRHGWTNRQGQG